MAVPDPWQILGIGRGADAAAIRAAYHRLALRHHPDRGGSAPRMAAINRAYAAVRNAHATRPASTLGVRRPPAAPAQGSATRPPRVGERRTIWERRAGQWLLVLAALTVLGTLCAIRQTEALLLVAGVLALVAIAERRPSGTPFHPADDVLDVALALIGWLLRLTASPRLDRPSRVSRRR
ncbi:MAG: J domain-containing protein [Chloroflexi bacterium]|nr:J domain-containing protein [Chloroflexota bacterium]